MNALIIMTVIFLFLIVLFRTFSHKKHSGDDDIVVRPLQRGERRNNLFTRRNIPQERETEREEQQEEPCSSTLLVGGKKLKKKKQAHKEAERERKQALAAAREAQKERLQREREREEEEKLERERIKAERLAELERIRREREELETKEYEKWKSKIQLTEQGEEEKDFDDEENRLERFISYITGKKMVVLEQLALEMNMKTEDVIQRIQLLQEEGRLTGVFDDRGKYIYISLEEMKAVAQLIQTRGRISIKELARRSVDWISLQDEA